LIKNDAKSWQVNALSLPFGKFLQIHACKNMRDQNTSFRFYLVCEGRVCEITKNNHWKYLNKNSSIVLSTLEESKWYLLLCTLKVSHYSSPAVKKLKLLCEYHLYVSRFICSFPALQFQISLF